MVDAAPDLTCIVQTDNAADIVIVFAVNIAVVDTAEHNRAPLRVSCDAAHPFAVAAAADLAAVHAELDDRILRLSGNAADVIPVAVHGTHVDTVAHHASENACDAASERVLVVGIDTCILRAVFHINIPVDDTCETACIGVGRLGHGNLAVDIDECAAVDLSDHTADMIVTGNAALDRQIADRAVSGKTEQPLIIVRLCDRKPDDGMSLAVEAAVECVCRADRGPLDAGKIDVPREMHRAP